MCAVSVIGIEESMSMRIRGSGGGCLSVGVSGGGKE